MSLPKEKVLRIAMKGHLRNSPQPTDVIFVFHVFQGKSTEQQKHTKKHHADFSTTFSFLLIAIGYSLLRRTSTACSQATGSTTDEVSIEDCQPGAFRILLRWIYGDEAVLDSILPSKFVAVLLAADRFGVQDLVSHLLGLAAQLITVDLFREILDVLEHQQTECANELHKGCLAYLDGLLAVNRFFEILDMVEHRRIECCKELTEKCLNYLDKNAAALVKHASFVDISHERLTKVLARNSLCVHENDLYRGATEWARAQVKRARKRRTHEGIREALGEALFLIRFPTMHPQEFKDGPAKDNILSAEEKLAVYDRILSEGPTSCAFSAEPRTGASTLPLRRFTPTYCQLCGKRLDDNDTCPVCGCCYLPSVECDRCDMRVQVGYGPFNFSWHLHNDGGYALVYQCSCGALNLSPDDYGPSDGCTRCRVKVWRCAYDGTMSTKPCRCIHCQEYEGF
ncbi:BTB/POZ domain-containing protein 2-like protein [Aphelenchoides avenae]|nr:BTB/POZ domain-containing protein 2-like protein [Aphelenchus avenae]